MPDKLPLRIGGRRGGPGPKGAPHLENPRAGAVRIRMEAALLVPCCGTRRLETEGGKGRERFGCVQGGHKSSGVTKREGAPNANPANPQEAGLSTRETENKANIYISVIGGSADS